MIENVDADPTHAMPVHWKCDESQHNFEIAVLTPGVGGLPAGHTAGQTPPFGLMKCSETPAIQP